MFKRAPGRGAEQLHLLGSELQKPPHKAHGYQGKTRRSKLCLLVSTALSLFLELPCPALSKSDKVQMVCEQHSSLSWWKLKTDEGQWFSHPLTATRQDGSPEATKTQTFPVLLNYSGNTDTPRLKSPVKSWTSPCRMCLWIGGNIWTFESFLQMNKYYFSRTNQSLQWLGSKSHKILHLKKETKKRKLMESKTGDQW